MVLVPIWIIMFGKGKNKQGEALIGAREEIIGVE